MVLCLLLVVLVVCGLTLASRNGQIVYQEQSLPYDGRFDEVDELPKAPEDLRYAFVIFRHGIRCPIHRPFQTQEQFDEMWPEGAGALTDDGKRLMYHVGQSLRTRYKNVIPAFHQDVVQFTSTSSARSTMSASCVAAGLFPLKERIFEDTLSTWQPIPVWHNTTYDKHKLFSEKTEQSHCLRYTEMREELRKAEKAQTPKIRKRYYKLLNSFLSKTYRISQFASSLMDNTKVYDIFKAQMLTKKTVPVWVPTVMPAVEKMKQVRMWNFIHGKTSMIQYFTGPLFNQILKEMADQSSLDAMKDTEQMEKETTKKNKRSKMHFHGSHDITVSSTMWVISRDETYFALPGDTIIIEMTSRAFVKVYLYVPLEKEKNKRFKEVSLKPLCGSDTCTPTAFHQSLEDIAFDEAEWKSRCNGDRNGTNKLRPVPQEIDEEDLQSMRDNLKLMK